MRSIVIISSLVMVLLYSCGKEDIYYQEYVAIPNKEWSMHNNPYFEFEIKDTLQKYDLYFNVRHTSAYEWENLWIITDVHFPNKMIDRDTLEFMLQDGTGKWLGSGNLHDGSYRFSRPKRFPQLGTYKISYSHAMRDTVLTDISDVGFKLVKAK